MAPKAWKRKATQMANAGANAAKIARELGVEHKVVAAYLKSKKPVMSWTSAKKRTTDLLRQLVDEEDRGKREELTNEVRKNVNFLYKNARPLSKEKLDKLVDKK